MLHADLPPTAEGFPLSLELSASSSFQFQSNNPFVKEI
jgi:hypothetical protein